MFIYSTQHGYTALHIASSEGHTAVVTLLLDHGADVRAVDRLGVGVLLFYSWW